MVYSEEFKLEVKELYPNSFDIIRNLESNSYRLGDLLQYEIVSFSAQEILNAKSLEDLQEKAKLIQKKQSIYNKWCKNYPYDKWIEEPAFYF